jgi:hypothetical protein
MAQGIGFSIPSNTAKWVVSQLLTQGKVRRSYLGLVGYRRQLDRRIVRFHKLNKETAVEIVGIEPTGPAKSFGLRTGGSGRGHQPERRDQRGRNVQHPGRMARRATAPLDRYPGQGAYRDEHRPHRGQIGRIHFFGLWLEILC